MTVQFGYALPFGPPADRPRAWNETIDAVVEQLRGHVDSLWMTDHFFWEGEPTYEAWTTMAYMAARYPDMIIGSAVLGQSYRNPAMTAKMAATLYDLCGGKLIFGYGAGWKEDEYHAYGFEYPSPGTRVAQLEDAIEIIKRLWTEPGPVTYEGAHYSIRDAYSEPKLDPVPTIMIGGGGRKTMMIAAKHADWWNIPDANFETYQERAAILKAHCESIGRDFSSIRLTWFGRLAVAETEARALELGGGKWTPDNAFVGTPEQVVAQLTPFIELGADYFMAEILGLPDKHLARLFIEEVLPAVQELGGS